MLRYKSAVLFFLLLIVFFAPAGCATEESTNQPPDISNNQEPLGQEPSISLYDNATGQRKDIMIEEYLLGVVAAEMDTKWPVNALAAQAILARTFTMENIESGRVRQLYGTDASTSVEEFQAYNPDKINDNVRQAVERTRGEVVTYNGSFIHAWFSACDGGVSATAEEGLAYKKEPTPYVRAGVQDDCLSITETKNKSWQVRIPVAQVRSAVTSVTGKDPGAVTSASVSQRGPSGRAVQLKIGKGEIGGPALRLALGSEKVRSMFLTDIRVEGGALVLAGKGYGHGVGMCQWGARLMAEQGKSPEDIIGTYFEDIEIQRRW